MPDPVRAEFRGSTVLLTGVGADGQVGQVVARAFAEQGASLILVDRTADHVDARVKELTRDGLLAAGYPCDLTDGAAVRSLVARIRENHGDSIHALVHMAGGFAMSGPVAESTDDVWNRQIAINLTTAFNTARAVLPMVRAGKGAIVFFASEAVLPGSTGARDLRLRRRKERRGRADARHRRRRATQRRSRQRRRAVVDSHGDQRSRDGRQDEVRRARAGRRRRSFSLLRARERDLGTRGSRRVTSASSAR